MNMDVLHLQHMDTLSFHLKCTAETSKLITVFHSLLPENDVVWSNNRDFEGLVCAYPSSDSRRSYDVTWETPPPWNLILKRHLEELQIYCYLLCEVSGGLSMVVGCDKFSNELLFGVKYQIHK
jgi:hypothetical protein